MKKRARDPLLLEIVAWVAAMGRITEGWLTDPDDKRGAWLYGYAEQGHVRINPVPETLDTLVHEVLHVIRPSYTELGVRRKTKALMRQMTDPELQTLWAIYQDRLRRDKKQRRPRVVHPPAAS